MEQRVIVRFSEAIVQKAMHCYGIEKDQIQILDSFESYIYEFKNETGEYILRISHSIRRNKELIHGEVDWINYLADHGVSVARAIQSKNNQLVEAIEDQQGGFFLATAFVRAVGRSPWELWTPVIFESYGQLIGRIHAITKQYQPSHTVWKRAEWDDPIFEFVTQFLPDSEVLARKKYLSACNHVRSIPKDKDTYGLIHQDAHGSNLVIDDMNQITLFDFDDCCYSWFINDIAIVLFYIVQDAEDWKRFCEEFMTDFLQGYLQYCSLDLELLKEIPYFLKIREIELYAVMHRDFDLKNINNEWCERFMHERKYRIENDIPFIDFDFNSLRIMI